MKKICLLVLLVCLLPVVSLAAEIVDSGTCGAQGDNLTYTLDSDGVLTISGRGQMADNVWKDTVNVKKLIIESGVTSIGNATFRNCALLESVTMPDDLETIGKQAFYCCFKLSDVTIGSGVKRIGEGAFDQCGFTTLTIPDSVETIDDEAFLGCINLSNLTIGSNVKSIPQYAFASCRELTSVTIPDSIESIGVCAFIGCEKLKNLKIGSGMKVIYYGAFSECAELSEIWYLGAESEWDNIDKRDHWDESTPGSKRFHCIAASGTGGAGEPYSITDADHWDTLAQFVNDGTFKTGEKHFRLDRAITVTTMLGTSDHPFSGTFDGDGKTLTFNAENTDLNVRTAPFAYVKDAEIKNLCTAGKITGSSNRASGLIGENYGTSTVTNCRSSLTISGGAFVGGFCIGAGDNLDITGCVFDGKITATKQSGGFVGWSTTGLRITDCLFAPKEGSSISGGTFYYKGNGDGNLTNSYYLTLLGNAQGKQARTVAPDENVSIDFGKKRVQYQVSGITAYPVGLKYGESFYAGGSENVTMGLNAEMQKGKLMKGFIADAGMLTQSDNGWTLVMPDENVTIFAEYISIEGSGVKDNPWKISSAEVWDALAFSMENGLETDGKFFVLTADISVITMIGTSTNPFGGTFDGSFNGKEHTLEFSLKDHPEGAAPFRYIKGATIRNLHVTGSVLGDNRRASGLIGENSGTSTVTNCRVSVTLSGGSLIGGFCIGTGERLTISGCAFDGQITGEPTQSGCFVAWGTNDLSIADSIAAPQSGSAFTGGTFCFPGNGAPKLSNCYYKQSPGNAQGKQAFSVIPSTGVTVDFGSGSEYSVSGITVYPVGLAYAGAFYAGKGETVELQLHSKVPEGEYVFQYIASGNAKLTSGAGTAWKLTMPDENVTITVQTKPIEPYGTATFTLPTGTKSIGKNAFAGIKAEVVYVPDQCDKIEAYAFRNCTNLKKIRLPNDCEIDDTAFYGCTNLIAIYTSGSGTTKDWAKENGFGYMTVEK